MALLAALVSCGVGIIHILGGLCGYWLLVGFGFLVPGRFTILVVCWFGFWWFEFCDLWCL